VPRPRVRRRGRPGRRDAARTYPPTRHPRVPPRPKTKSWVGYTGFDGTSSATTSSTRPSTIASMVAASPVTEHPPFASAFWKDLRNLMSALFRQFGSIACPLPNDVEWHLILSCAFVPAPLILSCAFVPAALIFVLAHLTAALSWVAGVSAPTKAPIAESIAPSTAGASPVNTQPPCASMFRKLTSILSVALSRQVWSTGTDFATAFSKHLGRALALAPAALNLAVPHSCWQASLSAASSASVGTTKSTSDCAAAPSYASKMVRFASQEFVMMSRNPTDPPSRIGMPSSRVQLMPG